MESAKRQRFETVDCLRGLASLSVCWFHLTNGNEAFLGTGPLKYSGSYGWLGVEIFFVISGFVIPYSLYCADYRVSSFSRFVLKRIIRLDPPYLITLGAIVALGFISSLAPGFTGEPFAVSVPQLILHLGYANVYFNYPWLNPVFWTLAIEFQYYVLIGLAFPLLRFKGFIGKAGLFVSMSVLSFFIPSSSYIFHYGFLFCFGILLYLFKVKHLTGKTFFLMMLVASFGVYLNLGILITVVGLSTVAAIAFLRLKARLLIFLGNISYSLYLLHVPIGGRVINLSLRMTQTAQGKIAALMIALSLSILAAYLLYRLVEKPARQWSSTIGYRRAKEIDAISINDYAINPQS